MVALVSKVLGTTVAYPTLEEAKAEHPLESLENMLDEVYMLYIYTCLICILYIIFNIIYKTLYIDSIYIS